MGGWLLMAHRGHQCGTWGPARRRLRAHPGDVLERLVATKCPRMLLLEIHNWALWADILIFVLGGDGRQNLFKHFDAAHKNCVRYKRGGGGTAFVKLLVSFGTGVGNLTCARFLLLWATHYQT